jgi:uncharacterized membrane protein
MPNTFKWPLWFGLGLVLMSVLLSISLFWTFGFRDSLYIVVAAIFLFVLGIAMLLVGPLARIA